jgi:hypothetical protein
MLTMLPRTLVNAADSKHCLLHDPCDAVYYAIDADAARPFKQDLANYPEMLSYGTYKTVKARF